MEFFKKIQTQLEDIYGVKTGLDVRDFVRSTPSLKNLGEMIVEQDTKNRDINLALLFDRDVLAAFETQSQREPGTQLNHNSPDTRAFSVSFEEISHFVYLSFNHHQGRDITVLELEMQSEVDRILLAFHGPLALKSETQKFLLSELLEKTYPLSTSARTNYELARQVASAFIRLVGTNPAAWSREEFNHLREFFHNDLGGKINLSKNL